MRARSHDYFCRAKAISTTYSESVYAVLVIQHVKRMRRIILSSVVCLVLPYFSTLCNKRHDIRKTSYLTQNVCFGFAYNFCLKHFSFEEEFSDDTWLWMYTGLQAKHPLFLPYCKETRIISTVFRQICEFQISWNPLKWEPSCSVRTDRQTDTNKPTAAFRNFAKASKI